MKLVVWLLFSRSARICDVIHACLVTWLGTYFVTSLNEWNSHLWISTSDFIKVSPKIDFRGPCSVFVYFANREDFVKSSVADVMDSIKIRLNIIFVDIGWSKFVCCGENKGFGYGIGPSMFSPFEVRWWNGIIRCKYINISSPFQCLVYTSLITQWLTLKKSLDFPIFKISGVWPEIDRKQTLKTDKSQSASES